VSRARGEEAESCACSLLRNEGFEIIDRNVYSRYGEIDIIALRDEVLHFVEVKSAPDYEGAVRNITPRKIGRILKTAEFYMKKHDLSLDYCLDAVIVVGTTPYFLPNITL